MSIQVAPSIKDLSRPVILDMAPLITVPYWVVDLLKEKGLPMSTLLNREQLAGILTATDLELVLHLDPFYSLREPAMEKQLSPYTNTLTSQNLENVINRANNWDMSRRPKNETKAHRLIQGNQYGPVFNEPVQYVKPAGSGSITCEYGMDIILFVIDDTTWGDKTDGLLILGCYLSETVQSDDIKSDEIMRLQANLALLSRYYGAQGLAKTPLMARFIELTQVVVKEGDENA